MGRIIAANADRNGFVRSVTLSVARRDENDAKHQTLDRPVNKIVLLLESQK